MNETTIHIEELCCVAEEDLIRSRLSSIENIDQLEFNHVTRTVRVTHALEDDRTLFRAISGLGMTPRFLHERDDDDITVQRRFWTKPATILAIVSGLFATTAEVLHFSGIDDEHLVLRLFAVVAMIAGGFHTAGRAWHAVRTLTLNIHVLMIVAVVGALLLGEWTEGAMVIFLFAVAELIEERSMDRARGAIRNLLAIAPQRASVLRGLSWEEAAVNSVAVGEIVRIKPGERVPLDGVVRHGISAVDQAPITGESMPVEKGIGDEVFAGSLNGAGTFDFEVTQDARNSTISRIVKLVEEAAANRTKAERFVDRFARRYTPSIVLAALLVGLLPPLLTTDPWSLWFYRALVLLVIGCPCALVIATPVAAVSGLAGGARRGILIKGASFLEQGSDLRMIAFDKTGTLTEGRPRVSDVIPLSGSSSEYLLHLAAAVEARSEHPVASAIIAAHEEVHADEDEIIVHDFLALPGRGVRGRVDGETIYVGNHRMAHDMGICSEDLERRLQELEMEGKTAMVVATAQAVIGIIAAADAIRESSRDAVDQLHALGIRTAVLTGDNSVAARRIARDLGIDDVRADLLPEEKIAAVGELQRAEGSVGMVGDGVNDVPALAQADVGFAMGSAATHVAIETADVALMDEDLRKIPQFISTARRTISIMKQNIAIALGLKGIFFILALMGEATLWMAVFADMGAALIVVGNALRARR